MMVFGNLFPPRLEPINSTKGLFYSGRIGFLPGKKRKIQPIPQKSSSSCCSSSTQDESSNHFRSSLRKTPSKIYIPNIVEDSWNLEEYGGLKMWVNQTTAEVSITNPTLNKALKTKPKSTPKASPSDQMQSAASKPKKEIKFPPMMVDRRLPKDSSQYGGGHGFTRVSIFASENPEVQEAFDILDPKFTFKQEILHQISPFK